MDDGVGINVESYLDLRYTAGCRGNTSELEITEKFIVANKFSVGVISLSLYKRATG